MATYKVLCMNRSTGQDKARSHFDGDVIDIRAVDAVFGKKESDGSSFHIVEVEFDGTLEECREKYMASSAFTDSEQFSAALRSLPSFMQIRNKVERKHLRHKFTLNANDANPTFKDKRKI